MWPISVHFLLVALVGLAICVGAGWLLWRGAGSPPAAGSQPIPGQPTPLTLRDQFDLVKIALSIVAGVGGLIALVVAYRRQRDSEKANRDAYHDATERRVTELYTKAADQLGNDKAPVRLAGLYSMERLAQSNPEHRQTIVNILCAYLRMPYAPHIESAGAAQTNTPATGDTNPDTAGQQRQAREEREVRLTAQRILTDHLRKPDPNDATVPSTPTTHWPNLNLDLTDATLVDFDFRQCRANVARFNRATFSGAARFDNATFTGDAWFVRATFTSYANFGKTTFTGKTWFGEATFTDYANFDHATFTGEAKFGGVMFRSEARFVGTTFTDIVGFGGTTFMRTAWFLGTTFAGDGVSFSRATFTGPVWFGGAIFTGLSLFGSATFTNDVTFENATFYRGNVDFSESQVENPVNGHSRTWPPGWRVKIDQLNPNLGFMVMSTEVDDSGSIPIP